MKNLRMKFCRCSYWFCCAAILKYDSLGKTKENLRKTLNAMCVVNLSGQQIYKIHCRGWSNIRCNYKDAFNWLCLIKIRKNWIFSNIRIHENYLLLWHKSKTIWSTCRIHRSTEGKKKNTILSCMRNFLNYCSVKARNE